MPARDHNIRYKRHRNANIILLDKDNIRCKRDVYVLDTNISTDTYVLFRLLTYNTRRKWPTVLDMHDS